MSETAPNFSAMYEGWDDYLQDYQQSSALERALRSRPQVPPPLAWVAFSSDPQQHAEASRRWLARDAASRELFADHQVRSLDRLLLPPGGPGYGHSPIWPFDQQRAVRNPGYARGVARAINNEAFHPAWRARAEQWFRYVEQQVHNVAVETAELEARFAPHELFE